MLNEAFPGYKAQVNPLEMASYIFNFANTASNILTEKLYQYPLQIMKDILSLIPYELNDYVKSLIEGQDLIIKLFQKEELNMVIIET